MATTERIEQQRGAGVAKLCARQRLGYRYTHTHTHPYTLTHFICIYVRGKCWSLGCAVVLYLIKLTVSTSCTNFN